MNIKSIHWLTLFQTDVQKWESRQYNLSQAIKKMEQSKTPKSEIDLKVAELEATKNQLKLKWILDLRDQLHSPEGELEMTMTIYTAFLCELN